MKNVKVVNFLDLSNETLKELYNFSCYNTDKIIINYKQFNEWEIKEKIVSLTNTFQKAVKIIHNDDMRQILDLSTEDDKTWINLRITECNGIESIHCNENEMLEIIRFLLTMFEYAGEYDVEVESALIDYIQEKTDDIFCFRKKYKFRDHIELRYFNDNPIIETNLIK